MTDPDKAAKAGTRAAAKTRNGSALPAGPMSAGAGVDSQPPERAPIDQLCINTIRTLSMDTVQQAGSAHPGLPTALAPVAYALWQGFLRFDPAHPLWPNRDRFVLSDGHASMVLCALLHLTGTRAVDTNGQCLDRLLVSLDDIGHIRASNSHRPGHPDHSLTTSTESLSGPLGQGCAASVGMAITERLWAAHFNRPGFALFDYDVYAVCGDDDILGGITSEVASRAGHLMLGNLCWIYHNNRITSEGHADLALSDDVAARFLAYGWNVQKVSDANDTSRIARAIEAFGRVHDVPTLIILESHTGFAAPYKHDTAAELGQPAGEEQTRLAKRSYNWPEDAKFLVPEGVRAHFDASIGRRGRRLEAAWTARLAAYRAQYPALAEEIDRMRARDLPGDWERALADLAADPKALRHVLRLPRC
ncbi:MAG: hypothetical protein KKH72_10175 [Alphaproteobacteria bacterium]|nr:hypothetical protein [Alphaproteobacteria bacterium]